MADLKKTKKPKKKSHKPFLDLCSFCDDSCFEFKLQIIQMGEKFSFRFLMNIYMADMLNSFSVGRVLYQIVVLQCFLISIASGALSSHQNFPHIHSILNPFTPLALYDPPCSFDIFRLGHKQSDGVPPGSTHCKKGQSMDAFQLCTPCEWDCVMGNNWPVDYFYELYMPSRTYECQCYCTHSMTPQFRKDHGYGAEKDERKAERACASTFVVDDEMEQTINVLQSINMQTPHYTVVEVGSRQGQWALKAAQIARREGIYKSVYACSIELDEDWKGKQKEKIRINELEDIVHITPYLVTEENYPALIKNLTMRTGSWEPINYMDWDCQGCEKILASDSALKLYEENILSLFIAVHDKNHDIISKFYKKDAIVDSGHPNIACDNQNRIALTKNRAFVDDAGQCLQDSPFGPIYFRDGTFRVFNKKLFDKLGYNLHMELCPPWERS